MITYKCESCGKIRKEEGEKTETIYLAKCNQCINFDGKKANTLFDKAMTAMDEDKNDDKN